MFVSVKVVKSEHQYVIVSNSSQSVSIPNVNTLASVQD
jgi:hypothetical protein